MEEKRKIPFLLWPLWALFQLVLWILKLTGRLVGAILGLVIVLVGVVLSITVIGAVDRGSFGFAWPNVDDKSRPWLMKLVLQGVGNSLAIPPPGRKLS